MSHFIQDFPIGLLDNYLIKVKKKRDSSEIKGLITNQGIHRKLRDSSQIKGFTAN